MNSSKINIIIILTIKLKVEISTNKKDSILIHCCQVAKIDNLDKDNINNNYENIVVS